MRSNSDDRCRLRLSLNKDAPVPRDVEWAGNIVCPRSWADCTINRGGDFDAEAANQCAAAQKRRLNQAFCLALVRAHSITTLVSLSTGRLPS
jgi:hypothetical protein